MAKIEIFLPRHRILLYYAVSQKFARNGSISYHFQDIFNVLFSAKIQDGRQKWRKLNFFPVCIGWYYTTMSAKNLLKISLSLTVFEIFTLFHFPLKSRMAAKISPLGTGNAYTTLWVKNLLKIALYLTISKIFSMFFPPLKSKTAAKSGEN